MPKIPLAHLKKLFTYEPETGTIYHNPDRPRETFNVEQGYKQWLRKLAGKKAGSMGSNSRRVIGVMQGREPDRYRFIKWRTL